MPLELLPDLLDDATHDELDKTVTRSVIGKNALGGVSDLQFTHHFFLLLNQIVSNDENLDRKYLQFHDAAELIDTHQELRDMLSSVWRCKAYRNIRNLAILRAPGKAAQVTTTAGLQPTVYKLSQSFQAEYHGAAVNGFYEYLTRNEKLFRNPEPSSPGYYAKFCSIVQSSGTGKSRMLTELSKNGVVVIYMNLREKTDESGFPVRDPIPSQILSNFTPTKKEYRIVCYAFFTALFDTLEKYLASRRENVVDWIRQMCDMKETQGSIARSEFFREVAAKYSKLNPTADTLVDKTAEGLSKLSLSEENDDSHQHPLSAELFAAYRNMTASLEMISSDVVATRRVGHDNPYQPKLVIAFDEAHPLTPMHGEGEEGYRPADEVCRVVNQYSHDQNHAVWVVFASTTSKVSDFSPPNQKYNSARVAERDEKLFPPYTQPGWDQCAPWVEDVDIEDISRLSSIIGYGRPLWSSLMTALADASNVVSTAQYKLCGAENFDTNKMNHVLAVLGQRFAVEVTFGHPDSVEHLETGVASHLRVCLATSLDRNRRFTSYPSEPFLSCVAAMELHAKPENVERAMATLLKAVISGMIHVGQRGELASRFLWLLAKDFYVRSKATRKPLATPSKWSDELLDCKMIPVVEWLEFVFGKRVWKDGTTGSLSREEFKNAYLNFSHWICMEKNIASGDGKDGSELSLSEWTRRHWQRTSAVQCCHQQPRVDKVIPIYFKDGPTTAPVESRMSQIFISDKARESRKGDKELSNITRRHKSIGGDESDSTSYPYIAILADLGQPPAFNVTFPERNVHDRCMRIYAGGCNEKIYPFLANHKDLVKNLDVLVHLRRIPITDMACVEYLLAQAKFGSTSSSKHMHWENARNVPEEYRATLAT